MIFSLQIERSQARGIVYNRAHGFTLFISDRYKIDEVYILVGLPNNSYKPITNTA